MIKLQRDIVLLQETGIPTAVDPLPNLWHTFDQLPVQ